MTDQLKPFLDSCEKKIAAKNFAGALDDANTALMFSGTSYLF